MAKQRSSRARQSLDQALGAPRRRSKRSKPIAVPVEGDYLRLHQASGQGYVLIAEVDGGSRRRVYLGPFLEPDGKTVSVDAIQAARRLLRDAALGVLRPEKARGRSVAQAVRERRSGGVRVAELVERYRQHVARRYARRATQIPHYAQALDRLLEHAGDLAVADFGPLTLASLRASMAAERCAEDPTRSKYVRRSINEAVARIIRAFTWGVSVELVPESILGALKTLEPLARGEVVVVRDGRGRSREVELRESRKVTGVPLEDVKAVLPFLSRQLQAVVRLQVLTGARPSELLGLRPVDIDKSGPRWVARPASHKNSWRGEDHGREIVLPREAEALLERFMDHRLPTAPMFSASEAEAERMTRRTVNRKCDRRHGNRPGYSARVREGREPERAPGSAYTSDSYRRAISRACDAAGVDRWTPYQLRHLAGELAEAALDEVHTSALLGHKDESVTRRYHGGEQRRRRATAAADALGRVVRDALGESA